MTRGMVLLLLAVVGCSRATDGPSEADASPPALRGPSGLASSPTGQAPTGKAAWKGTYKSAPGAFSVPDGGEWSGVNWRGADATDGIGEGELELDVDEAQRVLGWASGAIGDAVIVGMVSKGAITASVLRKANDQGLTGTLVASLSGASGSGSMRLSPNDARIIREATFSIAKVPGQ